MTTQVMEMKPNFFEKVVLSPKVTDLSRTRIKMALRQIRDWLNNSKETCAEFQPVMADFKTIDERIREQRLKFEGYRFPYHF